MTQKIKFSKEYEKLHHQKQAILLNVKRINYDDVTKELIEYDTKAKDGSYYLLPKTELIHLTFLGDKLIPFCTIRKYSIEKEKYYRNEIHNVFDIVITKSEDRNEDSFPLE